MLAVLLLLSFSPIVAGSSAPDLAASGIDFDAWGSYVAYTVSVVNVGHVPADVVVSFWIDGAEFSIMDYPALPAGYTVSFTSSLPSDLVGMHLFEIIVPPAEGELVTSNNAFSRRTPIDPLGMADMLVDIETIRQQGTPPMLSVELQYCNVGGAPSAAFREIVTLHTQGVAGQAATSSIERDAWHAPLAVGECIDVEFVVPSERVVGRYSLEFAVETNGTNAYTYNDRANLDHESAWVNAPVGVAPFAIAEAVLGKT